LTLARVDLDFTLGSPISHF